MTIFYADKLGLISIETNENGVQFCDGYAYFNDPENIDYRIPIEQIKEII